MESLASGLVKLHVLTAAEGSIKMKRAKAHARTVILASSKAILHSLDAKIVWSYDFFMSVFDHKLIRSL